MNKSINILSFLPPSDHLGKFTKDDMLAFGKACFDASLTEAVAEIKTVSNWQGDKRLAAVLKDSGKELPVNTQLYIREL